MRVCTSGHIIVPLFLAHVVGAIAFQNNCSLPTQSADFVSGSNVRSTLDILWSSLLAIFLCTWTAQHLNLPSQEDEEGFFKLLWYSIWRKLKWMLVAIVMPEFMLGKALGDAVAAYRSSRCKDMRAHAKNTNAEWTLTHGFYANMGGIILRESTLPAPQNALEKASTPSSASSSPSRTHDSQSTSASKTPVITHVLTRVLTRVLDHYLCRDQGAWRQDHNEWGDDDKIKEYGYENTWSFDLPIALNAAQLCILMSRGLIRHFPSIPEKEILDKSKEDLVIKALALVQLAWFVVQLATRKARGLPCAQLEIAVLGFAICTIATYLLWLKKPKDVKVATPIFATGDFDGQRSRLVHLTRPGFFENVLHGKTSKLPAATIPNDAYNKEAIVFSGGDVPWNLNYADVGFMLGAVVFGACHCIAWDFEFPTAIERIIWIVASLVTTAIMPLFYLSWWSLEWVAETYEWKESSRLMATRALSIPPYVLYALCRIYIMVELFRSLAYLPPDAFVSTWSASVPHIS